MALQAEASEQHSIEVLPTIDPADRKFFNPGYGAIPGVSKEVEVLSTIDPADRKFFSPGYGAVSGAAKEVEVVPTVDPDADIGLLEFFSPGYGAQTTSANGSEAILLPVENKMGEWSAIWFLLK
jgi:hypothetical protein